MTTQEPPGKPPAPPRESAKEGFFREMNFLLTAFLWITAVSLALIIGSMLWSALTSP